MRLFYVSALAQTPESEVVLPAPKMTWAPRAVNSSGGEKCPSLFSGSEGLCFAASEASEVIQYLRVFYPKAFTKATLFDRAYDTQKAMKEVIKEWKDALVSKKSQLAASQAGHASANTQVVTLSTRLSEKSESSMLKTILTIVGSFVAGAATTVAITWAVRR